MRRLILLPGLSADEHGAVAVETALIAPVLVLMSIGGFQASMIVSRQAELQSAAAEGAAIALANKPDDEGKRETLKGILQTSTNSQRKGVSVTVDPYFRCGDATALVTDQTTCAEGEKISRYVRLSLVQTYTPIWAKYGMGSSLRYGVTRYVMFSQSS